MKVLITGAAGFIGSNLVRYIVAHRPEWEVTALDLLTYAGNLENLDDLLQRNVVTFVKADIRDAEEVAAVLDAGQFDVVMHLAAESHVDRSILSAQEFVQTNVAGTQVLLTAARSSGVKRFLHVSTDEVYGSLGPTGKFVETTPLDPSSPYSASKAASDLLALAAHRTHGDEVIVTRCTNNYGPYQFPEKLIPLFITNAFEDTPLPLYGDGMNVRSWLHVDDHCEALCLLVEKGRSGEVYNIGGGDESEIPNREVTEKILSIVGKPQSLITRVADRPGHDRRYAVDYAKIHHEVGWQPRMSFAEGLAQTVVWYRENEPWWRRVKSGEYMKFYEKNYLNREEVSP